MMKTKIVVSFLLAVILSACASTDNGKPVATKDPEEKVYVTGSFLSHKSTDSTPVNSISGDDVNTLRTNITPANTPNR
jgi:hypothetical protein